MPDKRLVLFDTLSTVAWILMDASWMLGFKAAGLPLAIATITTLLLVMPFDERRLSILLLDGAVTAWACMNAAWMLSDIGVWSHGQSAAKGALGACGLLLLLAFVTAHGDKLLMQALLRRFRRFRLRRRP